MSMKNPNDTIGNRTRDLPACSAVHQQGKIRRRNIKMEQFVISFKPVSVRMAEGIKEKY
jgi:hypothetical protein